MPTQNQYSQAVLKAQLVSANYGNSLVLAEMGGCMVEWGIALCQYQQIQGALYFLSIGDYTSDQSVYFYNAMLEIAGLNYLDGVTPDPNAQLPGGIVIVNPSGSGQDFFYTEVDLLDSGGGNWYLPLINKAAGNTPLPGNYRPVLLTVNGTSFTPTYDTNFSPTRLYGFASNIGPQVIVVTIVIT